MSVSSFAIYTCILVMHVSHSCNFTGWKEALYVHYLPADRRCFMFSPQRHTQTDSNNHLRDARWKESDKMNAIHKTPRPFNGSVSTIYLSNTKTWVCKNRQISSVWFSDGVQTHIRPFLIFLTYLKGLWYINSSLFTFFPPMYHSQIQLVPCLS